MRNTIIIIFILGITTALMLLSGGLLVASIVRRVFHDRKYRKLDLLREIFKGKILGMLESGDLSKAGQELSSAPRSTAWPAIEDVLLRLRSEEKHQMGATILLSTLGYPSFYKDQLAARSVQTRAMSIDKLGKMRSRSSVPKLVSLLDEEEPEIVSVTIRALSKIGGQTGLKAIIDRLPVLLGKGLVTSKALETSLLAFGANGIPFLAEQRDAYGDPRVASIVLGTLARLPADPRSARLATDYLSHENAEVRSRALQALGRAENNHECSGERERIILLLRDPVWYVRLQAIRSLRMLACEPAVDALGKLIFDGQWQVRNEAARTLIMLGDRSLDVLLEVLAGGDRYAKDSVCEEAEITEFTTRLMENLGGDDATLREKSRRILEIMHALGFSTPLLTYAASGDNEAVKQQVWAIVKQRVGA